MVVPKRLKLHESLYALDGGTCCLIGADESGQAHEVLLAQDDFLDMDDALDLIPGRLYFNGESVPIRGELESQVLALLRGACICPMPQCDHERGEPSVSSLEDDIRESRDQIVETVESPRYVSLAKEVDQLNGRAAPDAAADWPRG